MVGNVYSWPCSALRPRVSGVIPETAIHKQQQAAACHKHDSSGTSPGIFRSSSSKNLAQSRWTERDLPHVPCRPIMRLPGVDARPMLEKLEDIFPRMAYVGTVEAPPSALLALILSRMRSAKVRCCPSCPSGACKEHMIEMHDRHHCQSESMVT